MGGYFSNYTTRIYLYKRFQSDHDVNHALSNLRRSSCQGRIEKPLPNYKAEKEMSTQLVDAVSILMTVILRKSIYMCHEFACLFMDIVSVLTSAVRYYSVLTRQQRRRSTEISTTTITRYSYSNHTPFSSMAARHDR